MPKDAPIHQPFIHIFLPQLSLDTCGFGFLNVFHTPIGPDIFGHIHWLAIRASLELCGDSVVVAVCRAEQSSKDWLDFYCGNIMECHIQYRGTPNNQSHG